MSDNPAGEKTEQPTPHRLREARKKGQVVRSTEICSAFNLLAVVFLLIMFGDLLWGWLIEIVSVLLTDFLLAPIALGDVNALILYVGLSFFKVTGLIFLTAVIVGLVSNYAQVGFIFSTEKLSPTFDKINPIEGFKRIASRRALFELVKSILKIVLVGVVTYMYCSARFESFLTYMYLSPHSFTEIFRADVMGLSLQVGIVFIILAVLDYIYQRQEHFKNLRMTKQEVKEEHKQMEGDPLIRSKLKEKQRSIVNQRMLQDVPQATVVITNPTELAVALKYSATDAQVPVVVAKGADLMAARIREKAKEFDILIVENKPVARILFEQVDVGQVIPADMYQSVAEILALVYQVNQERKGKI